jgi:hypothetical protein
VKVSFKWVHAFVLVFGGMIQKARVPVLQNDSKRRQKWSGLSVRFCFGCEVGGSLESDRVIM